MSGEAPRGVASSDVAEPGRPERDPANEQADGAKPGSIRGVLITIIGALITAGVATATVSSGPIGGGPGTETDRSCSTQHPATTYNYPGQVIRVLTDAQAAETIRWMETHWHAKVNPFYIPLKYVAIRLDWQNRKIQTVAAVPPPFSLKVGDRAVANSPYRDPTLPCHFRPWAVNQVSAATKAEIQRVQSRESDPHPAGSP